MKRKILVLLLVLLFLFIVVSCYDATQGDGKVYTKYLDVYFPSRQADYYEDTHGGFHGDGDIFMSFSLNEKELEKLKKDVEENSNWKIIDEESRAYLYVGGGVYNGYLQGLVPEFKNGYFCIYDKQTENFAFPKKGSYSHNYIAAVCSIEDKVIYIYGMDT